jgi:hypothetical protein
MTLVQSNVDQILLNLVRDGIVVAPLKMPRETLDPIIEHISRQPVYDAYLWARSSKQPYRLESDLETCCTTQETLLTAPGFLAFVDQFTPVAEAYLQEPALLYSLNAFWTNPGPSPPHPYYQQVHRDSDDRKFLVMFIYGSDVLHASDGPHIYGPGSHRGADSTPMQALGKAGTIILSDTSGLHMGAKPERGRRLIFWARWCVSEPPEAYVIDQLSPVDRQKVPHPYAEHLRLVMR